MLPNSPHDAIVRVWLEPSAHPVHWGRYLSALALVVLGIAALIGWMPQA